MLGRRLEPAGQKEGRTSKEGGDLEYFSFCPFYSSSSSSEKEEGEVGEAGEGER